MNTERIDVCVYIYVCACVYTLHIYICMGVYELLALSCDIQTAEKQN